MAWPRPGPGKTPGSKNKATLAREEQERLLKERAGREGKLPLQVILDEMNRATEAGETEKALAAAIAAAPYLHSRLASTESRVTSDNTHYVISETTMDVDEWVRVNGISSDNDDTAEGEVKESGVA